MLKNIIGSLGLVPNLLVKEYDKQQNKISALEDENAMYKADQANRIEAGMKKGGKVKMKSGGYVRSADGCAKRGKTRGKIV
jgi:hypothetical protein